MTNGRESLTRETLIAAVRAAAESEAPTRAVRALMSQWLTTPDALAAVLGDIEHGDEMLIHEDASVSVWHCRFWPDREVPPHEHRMPAFIGVYRGTEANRFYRRGDAGLEPVKTQPVAAGQILSIGADGVHSVSAAGDGPSHALHVYLGPLTKVERSLFDWDTGEALPFTDDNFEALTRPVAGR